MQGLLNSIVYGCTKTVRSILINECFVGLPCFNSKEFSNSTSYEKENIEIIDSNN